MSFCASNAKMWFRGCRLVRRSLIHITQRQFRLDYVHRVVVVAVDVAIQVQKLAALMRISFSLSHSFPFMVPTSTASPPVSLFYGGYSSIHKNRTIPQFASFVRVEASTRDVWTAEKRGEAWGTPIFHIPSHPPLINCEDVCWKL